MDVVTTALSRLAPLMEMYRQRDVRRVVFVQLLRWRRAIITRVISLVLLAVFPYLLAGYKSVHYYLVPLVKRYMQRYGAKVVEDDRLSNDDFEKWYGAQLKQIENGSQNLSTLQKLKLGLLQRVLGEPCIGTLRAVEDPRSTEGYVLQPTLPKRFAFAYQGKIFVREHCPVNPSMWTTTHNIGPIQSLLEDIDLFIRGGKSNFGKPIHVYFYTSGNGWRPNHTVRARPLESVSMLDVDKAALKKETSTWVTHKPARTPSILIYGPMGTGKSILPLALAHKFELKVYLLSLRQLRDRRSKVQHLLDSCAAGSMLVLDDLAPSDFGTKSWSTSTFEAPSDVPNTTPNLTEEDMTLADILRYLDEKRRPQDRPLVVVTCKTDSPQEASIDANLFTLTLKMDLATFPISYQMFNNMYSHHFAKNVDEFAESDILTMAECFAKKVPEHKMMPVSLEQFIMKKYPSDPHGAVVNVGDWCDKRLKEEWDARFRRAAAE